jgi:nucleoside-diphosphate-sugar epimerase
MAKLMSGDLGCRFSSAIADQLARSRYRVVVTGAGGWLGLATLEMLRNALHAEFEDRVFCFGSNARSLALRSGAVEQWPLAKISALPPRPTLVLHCAFLTKERAEQMDSDTYRHANRTLREIVLSSLDQIGAEAIFVPSSGAAREATNSDAPAAMRLYGELKCEDEDAFSGWSRARGRSCVVSRIFNLSGPYINKHQSYALASFILDALSGRPVRVLARHRVVRSYVAIRELMSIVFELLCGKNAEIVNFDTAGDEALEVRTIAGIVAEIIGNGKVDTAPLEADRPPDIYVGDGARYRALARQAGVDSVPFSTQVLETADYVLRR